ncbi:MAG TPA: hypothetical protein VFE78_37550 [Gemmataceae bacterium]|jgi:hypothetical protein|nr:hypothetical protein [Gemmataceae bacterium]
MNEQGVIVQLDDRRGPYFPGDVLSGSYRLVGEGTGLESVEVSVHWFTEGKGEEDLGVHHFEKRTRADGGGSTPASGRFSTRLPNSPLSYEGVLVKVVWRVNVRAVFAGGQRTGEAIFRLGDLRPAGEVPA